MSLQNFYSAKATVDGENNEQRWWFCRCEAAADLMEMPHRSSILDAVFSVLCFDISSNFQSILYPRKPGKLWLQEPNIAVRHGLHPIQNI